MDKEHLIQAIRQRNPSAEPDFLISFNENALNQYLDHLHYMVRPRQERNLWVRSAETPAILGRRR